MTATTKLPPLSAYERVGAPAIRVGDRVLVTPAGAWRHFPAASYSPASVKRDAVEVTVTAIAAHHVKRPGDRRASRVYCYDVDAGGFLEANPVNRLYRRKV